MTRRDTQLITRRQLLRRTVGAGVAVAGSGFLLAACDSGEEGGGELSCTDTSGLTQQQVQTRKTLEYADSSPKPDQTCDNCRFYQAKGSDKCGGCTIVPGPVHPKGWCKSWAKQEGA